MKSRNLPPLFFSVWLPTILAIFWRKRIHPSPASGLAGKGPLSFLIVRLDAMGDVVMTTPLFRALKTAHPRSRVTVAVQRAYKSLLATNPDIDEILTLPAIGPDWLPAGLHRFLSAALFYWTQLRGRYFDCAISPRWDTDEHLATFLCALSNAATRVGYRETASVAKQQINRAFDRAYNLLLPPGTARHETLRNLTVAEALGANSSDSHPEIHLTERDRQHAAELLRRAPLGAKLVALGIGAQSPGRRWPLERYAEAVAQLEERARVWPVVVCSAAELGEALKISRLLPGAPIIVSGERLRVVAAVLERCAVFIGNDSGCAHLAAAVRCKTVVISRHPRNGDPNHYNSPVRFTPRGRNVCVLQPATGLDQCSDCCVSPKPHCIRQVSVEEVVAAAAQMFSGSPLFVASQSSKRTPEATPRGQTAAALRQVTKAALVSRPQSSSRPL